MTDLTDLVFRSDFDVKLINSMASDDSVVRAARVSTQGAGSQDATVQAGLIDFLMRNRHGTPFEHNSFTFFVSAPIFVFREFQRHRIASYNEESGRYRELAPVFYVPPHYRPLIQVGKAGEYRFERGNDAQREFTRAAVEQSSWYAYGTYRELLNMGVAREVARMVLPVNTYSSMYVTINARSLMNFLSLRIDAADEAVFASYPQWEIERVAIKMEAIFASKMPVTHGTFDKNGRVAP